MHKQSGPCRNDKVAVYLSNINMVHYYGLNFSLINNRIPYCISYCCQIPDKTTGKEEENEIFPVSYSREGQVESWTWKQTFFYGMLSHFHLFLNLLDGYYFQWFCWHKGMLGRLFQAVQFSNNTQSLNTHHLPR